MKLRFRQAVFEGKRQRKPVIAVVRQIYELVLPLALLSVRHIADDFKDIGAAEKHAMLFEEAILSLATMPYRGAERKVGAFANKGYRQLFVKNYTIVYRVDEERKTVIIVTVRYSPSSF